MPQPPPAPTGRTGRVAADEQKIETKTKGICFVVVFVKATYYIVSLDVCASYILNKDSVLHKTRKCMKYKIIYGKGIRTKSVAWSSLRLDQICKNERSKKATDMHHEVHRNPRVKVITNVGCA